MGRRVIKVSLALVLMLTVLIGTQGWPMVLANTGDDLKEQIEELQEQQSELEEEASVAEVELREVEKEIEQVFIDLDVLEKEIAETAKQVDEKQGEIDSTTENVDTLREEIADLEDRIEQRDSLLKDRVRSMYKNGGVINYIEVILGAQNFGDLIERVNALNTIAQQDKNIIEQHQLDKEAVEEAKKLLEEELTSLEEQMVELESLLAEAEDQQKEKEDLRAQLESQQIELEEKIMTLEEEQEILEAQEAIAEDELAAWVEEQRRLEEERRRREEEERRRQEEERRRLAEQDGNSTESDSDTPASSDDRPGDTGGTLMRPATGSVTSIFGPRWGSFHHGIDIGKNGRSGDVPIVAAEAGVVVRSYLSSSYGNTVILQHSILNPETGESRTVTTLYAHMENRAVSSGDFVSRGQYLGNMGNTGRSFGPHLHFEVHEGKWNAAKSNAVDPLSYF